MIHIADSVKLRVAYVCTVIAVYSGEITFLVFRLWK